MHPAHANGWLSPQASVYPQKEEGFYDDSANPGF